MTPVHAFAQYLLRQDGRRDPARSALTNYFAHLIDPHEELNAQVIIDFYGYALTYDHWRQEGAALAGSVRAALTDFANKYSLLGNWSTLRHPGALQIIEIKDRRDVTALIDRHHPPTSYLHARVLWMEDGRALRLALSDSGLEVSVIPPLALVWGTTLVPVPAITKLQYGPDNELLPGVPQRLLSPLSQVHAFKVVEGDGNDQMTGTTLGGPALQTVGTLKGPLRNQPELFMALKRVEKYFIRVQSDPDYQELVYQLEKANARLAAINPSMSNHDGLAGKEFNLLLDRGRRALNTIFPNDRLLTLLVTHLDYGISQRRHRFKTGGHEPAPPTQ